METSKLGEEHVFFFKFYEMYVMSVLFIRVTKFIRSNATLNYYSVFIGALGNILYMLVLFSIHFMA